MRRVEEGIQRAVAQYLDMCLPEDAVWWHTPNGGARSKAEAGAFKAQGVKAGVPDVVIVYLATKFLWQQKGSETICDHRMEFPRMICIELKPPGRTLSKNQKEMKAKLERAGAIYAPVCRSVDDVKAFLEPLLPMRGR